MSLSRRGLLWGALVAPVVAMFSGGAKGALAKPCQGSVRDVDPEAERLRGAQRPGGHRIRYEFTVPQSDTWKVFEAKGDWVVGGQNAADIEVLWLGMGGTPLPERT